MARINLRPWREERNTLHQKRFVSNLLGSAVLAGLAIFAISYYYDMQMDRQQVRNEYLRTENARLDRQLAEINELNRMRDQLLARLQAIEDLQGSRPLIVRNFDEMVRVLPDDLYYTSVSRNGDMITIDGFAEQNRDVSALMRQLNSSDWFSEPNLSRVGTSNNLRQFNLSVPMRRPAEEGSAE
ncbi:PilN domain-containing protein [Nitrincola iocasae]|jgi:type IV pilus assembly protein PilN|uniref:PilN domain-containing protein n=1 Tax=Nitrincola iocasae TaxID=2614693 RepID=A0A5J6L9U6_9GAMM|nr:PilN domain-containing protein [Nitrincola iocasae]QEW05250.1 PilN domain-containing protein [Nitrincola iocasae]